MLRISLGAIVRMPSSSRANASLSTLWSHGESIVAQTICPSRRSLSERQIHLRSAGSMTDLCWCDEHGVERLRLPDIPFRADAASIVLQEPITLMKASPTATQIARLLAVDDAGTERLLGEFTFHHTRTLPGPGAW